MMHMSQNHGESVAQLRQLDRAAGPRFVAPFDRNQRRADTATRDMLVGDIF